MKLFCNLLMTDSDSQIKLMLWYLQKVIIRPPLFDLLRCRGTLLVWSYAWTMHYSHVPAATLKIVLNLVLFTTSIDVWQLLSQQPHLKSSKTMRTTWGRSWRPFGNTLVTFWKQSTREIIIGKVRNCDGFYSCGIVLFLFCMAKLLLETIIWSKIKIHYKKNCTDLRVK